MISDQIQKSRLALAQGIKDDAIKFLRKAVKIHEGHMDGSIPTSDESQEEMMSLMKSALSSLEESK